MSLLFTDRVRRVKWSPARDRPGIYPTQSALSCSLMVLDTTLLCCTLYQKTRKPISYPLFAPSVGQEFKGRGEDYVVHYTLTPCASRGRKLNIYNARLLLELKGR